MHTARYDKTHDLTDKRVLTVGIGSSGVQVIPKILHRVKELHVVAVSSPVMRLDLTTLLMLKSAFAGMDYQWVRSDVGSR